MNTLVSARAPDQRRFLRIRGICFRDGPGSHKRGKELSFDGFLGIAPRTRRRRGESRFTNLGIDTVQLHALVACSGVPQQHGDLLLWAALFAVNIRLGEMGCIDRRSDFLPALNLPAFSFDLLFVSCSLVYCLSACLVSSRQSHSNSMTPTYLHSALPIFLFLGFRSASPGPPALPSLLSMVTVVANDNAGTGSVFGSRPRKRKKGDGFDPRRLYTCQRCEFRRNSDARRRRGS